MKKNEEIVEQKQETKLIWKMKDLPTADSVGKLVDVGVITANEARSILFKEVTKDSDEVEALKEMVKSLQEMVTDLLSRQNNVTLVPYTKIVEVPSRSTPYWNKYWTCSDAITCSTSANGSGYTTYSMLIK